ncbi:MAG: flippase [Methanosarcinaceae archaeon]
MTADIEQRNIAGTRYSFIGRTISSATLFLLSIIVARYLGAEAFGELSLALTIIAFASVISDAGINRSVQKHISQYLGEDRESIQRAYKSILSIKALSGLAGLIILYAGAPVFSGVFHTETLEPVIKIGALLLAAIIFLEFNQTVLQGYECFKKICLANVLEAGLKLIFTVIIIYMGLDVAGIIAGYAASTLAVSIILTIVVYFGVVKPGNINRSHRNLTGEIIRYSPPILFSTIFFIMYTRFDILALGYFGETTDVGHYSLAVGLIDNLLIPVAAIETAVMPIAASLYGKKESRANLSRLFNQTLTNGFFFMMPVIFGLLVVARSFVTEVYGPEFMDSGLILMALTPFILTKTLAVLNGAYLIGANKAKTFMNYTFGAMLLNLFLLGTLVPVYGVYGAALARIISHAVLTFSMLLYIIRAFRIRIEGESVIKDLKIVASSVVMAVLCYTIMVVSGGGIPGLVLTIGSGVLIYVVLLDLTKTISFNDLLKIAHGDLSLKQDVK